MNRVTSMLRFSMVCVSLLAASAWAGPTQPQEDATALGIRADVFEEGSLPPAPAGRNAFEAVTHWDRLPLFAADVNQVVEMSDGTLLAATYTGVFRSGDGGGHWEAVVNGLPTATAIAIVCDASDRIFVSIYTRGIYKSLDGGDTWSTTGAASGRIVTSLAAVAQSIFAGTSDGAVFRSTNSGVAWQEFPIPYPTAVMVVTALTPDIVLAGTLGRGILRSIDAGATWSNTNLTSGFFRSLQPCAGGRVLAGSEAGPDIGGALHVSIDLGSTWSPLVNPFPGAIAGMAESGTTLVAAAVRSGVAVSTDNGQSWLSSMSGLSISFGSHAVFAGGEALYLGTRGDGVFRSTDDGASWIPANEGLTGYKVEDMTWTPAGVAIVATSAGGLFRSEDGGTSWKSANSGIASASVLSLACDRSDGALYAGLSNGLVCRSTDDGSSWINITGNLPGTDPVNAIHIDETTGDVWIGKYSRGVWKLAPGGATWVAVVCDLVDLSIASLVENDSSDLVAGTTFTGVSCLQGDTGCWSHIPDGMPGGPGPIESMVRGAVSRSLLAATSNGVFHLAPGASSWTLTSLLVPYVRSLHAAVNGSIYAGIGYFNVNRLNDVMMSDDDGETWTSLRGDMPTNDPINHVAVHGSDLFAGTWNGGLFVSRSTVSAVPDNEISTAWFGASYPNPFRTETRLSVRVTGTKPVTVRIYAANGQLVRTLVNGTLPAGNVTLTWDGRDERGGRAPMGVYVLTIESGGRRQSTKMTLRR